MRDDPILCCLCLLHIVFFNSKHSELHLSINDFKLHLGITKEIGVLGSVTLARQGMVSLSVLLVNNLLFGLGGESSVAVYAIISRLLMFSLFPVLGITQGFVPIAGFNYGADNKKRVEQVIQTLKAYPNPIADLDLPTSPAQLYHLHEQQNYPQPRLHADRDKGMSLHIGRIREGDFFHINFVCMAHNTIRGAAGGAILNAELLHKKGYLN